MATSTAATSNADGVAQTPAIGDPNAFDLASAMVSMAQKFGVDPTFFKATLNVENPNMDPQAINTNADGTKDIGLWQINSQHEQFLKDRGIIKSLADLADPATNTAAADAIFADLKRQGASTPNQFAAGFNTGKINNTDAPYVGKVAWEMSKEQEKLGGKGTRTGTGVGAQALTTVTQPTTIVTPAGTGTFDFGKNTDLMVGAMNATQNAISTATSALRTGFSNMEEARSKGVQTMLDLSAALAASVKGAASFKIKEEADTAAIRGMFGLDPGVANNLLATTATKAQALEAQHSQALQQYNALDSVSFFDNPLKWVAAQLNMPQAAAAVNNLAQQHHDTIAQAQDMISLSTAAVQNTHLAAATTSQETAENLAKIETLKGAKQMYDTGVLSAQDYIKVQSQIATLGVEGANKMLQAVQLDIGYAQKRYYDMIRGMQADLSKEKAEEQARIKANFATGIGVANTVLGTQFTPEQVRTMNSAGKDIIARVAATGKLGDSVPELVANQKYLADTPKNAGLRQTINQMQNAFMHEAQRLQNTVPDPKLRLAQASANVMESYRVYSNNVAAGGSNNPYLGGAPGAIIAANPGLQARIPTLAKILEPVMSQPVGITPDAISDMVVRAASTDASGKPTMPNGKTLSEIASEMEIYFKAVVANNNSTFKYSVAGAPRQVDYKATTTGLFGRSAIVDYTNKAQVMSVLLQKTGVQVRNSLSTEEIRKNIPGGAGGPGPGTNIRSGSDPNLPEGQLPTLVPGSQMPPTDTSSLFGNK